MFQYREIACKHRDQYCLYVQYESVLSVWGCLKRKKAGQWQPGLVGDCFTVIFTRITLRFLIFVNMSVKLDWEILVAIETGCIILATQFFSWLLEICSGLQ